MIRTCRSIGKSQRYKRGAARTGFNRGRGEGALARRRRHASISRFPFFGRAWQTAEAEVRKYFDETTGAVSSEGRSGRGNLLSRLSQAIEDALIADRWTRLPTLAQGKRAEHTPH